jgi:hypothetical protein
MTADKGKRFEIPNLVDADDCRWLRFLVFSLAPSSASSSEHLRRGNVPKIGVVAAIQPVGMTGIRRTRS